MRFIITKNYQALSKLAAVLVIKQLQKKKNTVLGLATGKTPLGLYKNLVKAYRLRKISFKKVIIFNLDELVGLKASNRQSYHYYLRHNLFKWVNVDADNIYLLNGRAKNFKKECASYEKLIKKNHGLDLLILGIGANGHLGFNEPGSSFTCSTRVVEPQPSTRQDLVGDFKSLARVPKKALTMGLATIKQAKKIILLASGQDKAKVVAQALKGKISSQVPASILQTHPRVTIILDKQAAGKLLVHCADDEIHR